MYNFLKQSTKGKTAMLLKKLSDSLSQRVQFLESVKKYTSDIWVVICCLRC